MLAAQLLAALWLGCAGPTQPGGSPSAAKPTPTAEPARRVTLIGAPPAAELLRRIDAESPAAIAAVEQFWGVDWPREIIVMASGTDAEFAAQSQLSDSAGLAAVTVADATGLRIVFAPRAAEMSRPDLRIVWTHELFHFAARAKTAPDAPRWITEGVADYVARPPQPVRPAQPPATLPADTDLATTGPALSAAYDRAWWFARFIAEDYDPQTLRRFYAAVAGRGHVDVDTAVRQVLGTGPGELLVRWQRWCND